MCSECKFYIERERILFLYIYLVSITMVTEHFLKPNLWHTQKKMQRKILYFLCFADSKKNGADTSFGRIGSKKQYGLK